MRFLVVITLLLLVSACRVELKFTEGNTGDAETALVRQFTVDAPLAPPTAGQLLTEKLQEVLLSQSRLDLISSDKADVIFEGRVSKYEISPVGIQSGDVAAQNRLLITVDVIFTNAVDGEQSYQQSFTRFSDFPGTTEITAVQDELIDEIYELITQDMYNKAFSNW